MKKQTKRDTIGILLLLPVIAMVLYIFVPVVISIILPRLMEEPITTIFTVAAIIAAPVGMCVLLYPGNDND